jgi:hypothetical protein
LRVGSEVGMTARRRALVLLVCLCTALVALAGFAGASRADSPGDTVWLCRPGLVGNPCAPDLTTTVYDARGRVVRVEHEAPPANPPVDCFYVYPTTSDEPTPQADFNVTPELRSIALYQAARYESECRVFAPVYRQITIFGLLTGGATPAMRETAYQDVRSAWLDYLAHDNGGRGVVFIGHSQGAGVLRRLLREEVDPNPAVRTKLVSAILLGGNVTVARGSDRGGDFQNIPACRTVANVGCVIAFSTFDGPVPANSLFGRTTNPAQEVLCTNPTALHMNGAGRADVVFPTEPFAPGTVIAGAIGLLNQPAITATTPWVEFRRAYRAQCVNDNGANVLHITPLGNSPLLTPSPDATWGLHLVDANIALGNLVGVVHRQAHRWAAVNR